MTPKPTFAALVAGALIASLAGPASAQAGYGYGTTQQPTNTQDVLGAILGAVFGTNGSGEGDWSQGRRPLLTNQASFNARVDGGQRDGSINRADAQRLRSDYADLVSLESRYTADGRVTPDERADLTQRYRTLAQRLDNAANGGGYDTGWTPLSQGSNEVYARIDAQVRARNLSTSEALRLRADYQSLLQLETTYGRDGLSRSEISDLQGRLDDINRRIGDDRDGGYGGNGNGGWTSLSQGASAFYARVDGQLRNRAISTSEATRLRTDYQSLIQVESNYARDGISRSEQADLQSRLDELNRRVGDNMGGGGGYPADARQRLASLERALYALPRADQDRLRVQLDDLTRLEAAYGRYNASSDERAYLDRRLGELETQARIRR